MKATAQYQADGETFRIEALRHDRTWGHGIDLTIFTASDVVWAKATFRNHPEFLDFTLFQSMSTAQLLSAAVSQLEQGGHENIKDNLPLGVQVHFRLNGIGQGLACEYPRPLAQQDIQLDGPASGGIAS